MEMVDEGERWAPRQESRPFAWAKLTDAQREVARGVRRLVSAIATHADTDVSRRFDPRDFAKLEPDKRNRVILIDGERGSGKTSVLLYLFQTWNERWIEGGPARDGDVKRAPTEPSDDPEPRDLDEHGVIPLRLVDLFPIPPGTHLLMHLIQVFERAIPDQLDERDPSSDRVRDDRENNLLRESSALSSRARWRSLLRTFATGWDDDYLKGRRRDLDPEAYTLELEEAERERRELHPSYGAFWEFIDALCCDFRAHHRVTRSPRRPLFVVGIDDADMNPSRARELLRVLQLLSHPRVVFILTGDAPMFPEVIVQQFEKDKELSPVRARAIATALCNKVIPRSQRFRIEPLAEAERWSRLEGALSHVKTGGTGRAPADLAVLMRNTKDLHALLPHWMRQLIDAENVLGRGELFPALEALAPPDDVHALRDTFVFERYTPKGDAGISLRMRKSLGWSRELSAPHVEDERLRVWDRAALQINAEGKPLDPPTLMLWLTLVAQVASIHPQSTYEGASTTVGPYELGVVEGRRELLDQDETWASFPWPFPDRANAMEVAVFLASWHADSLKEGDPIDERRILREYLACVVDTFDDDTADVWSLELPAVVARLVEMGRGDAASESRAGRGRRWSLDLAGLLAAPESGLSAEVANEFLALLSVCSGDRWAKRKERLKKARIVRSRWALQNALGVNDETLATSVLEEIDRSSTEYDWTRDVGDGSDPPPSHLVPAVPPVSPTPSPVVNRVIVETPSSVIEALREALDRRRVRTGALFSDLAEPADIDLKPLLGMIEEFGAIDLEEANKIWAKALAISGVIDDGGKSRVEALQGQVFAEQDFDVSDSPSFRRIQLGRLVLRGIPRRRLRFAVGALGWVDALFKALWDHTTGRRDREYDGARWFPVSHEAIGIELPVGSGWLGWPVRRWSTFAEAESYANAWNDFMGEIDSDQHAILPEIMGFELVHWYLTHTTMSLHRSPNYTSYRFGEAYSMFRNFESMVKNDLNDLRLMRGVFLGRFGRWTRHLDMLGFPESGLRGHWAELIFRWLTKFGISKVSLSSDRYARRQHYLTKVLGGSDHVNLVTVIDNSVRDDPEWAWFFQSQPATP